MPDPGLFILYVDSAPASADFYGALLGREPVESSPAFAMFALDGGARLGLWSRETVQPATGPKGDSGELCFAVPDVDAVHADWVARGLPILQPPMVMEFGRTFTAADPDGHRLRVYAPA